MKRSHKRIGSADRSIASDDQDDTDELVTGPHLTEALTSFSNITTTEISEVVGKSTDSIINDNKSNTTAILDDTKTIIEKIDETQGGYTTMTEKIDYVSETLVEQAKREKERADGLEKTCHQVCGKAGQQAFKRRKADEANWAHLRKQVENLTRQNETLVNQNGEKDKMVSEMAKDLKSIKKRLPAMEKKLDNIANHFAVDVRAWSLQCLCINNFPFFSGIGIKGPDH